MKIGNNCTFVLDSDEGIFMESEFDVPDNMLTGIITNIERKNYQTLVTIKDNNGSIHTVERCCINTSWSC